MALASGRKPSQCLISYKKTRQKEKSKVIIHRFLFTTCEVLQNYCFHKTISDFLELSLSKRGKVQNLSCESEFICMKMKSRFHNNSFALSFVLKSFG